MAWSRPTTSGVNGALKLHCRRTKSARDVEVDGEMFSVVDDLPETLPVSSRELDLYHHQFRDFLEKLFAE